jgi:hypothetical protein
MTVGDTHDEGDVCAYAVISVEHKLRQDLAALVLGHPWSDTLAEMALALARHLDAGPPYTAAGLSRELRANLLELARFQAPDTAWEDMLSTPVRYTDDEGSTDDSEM